MTIDEIVERLSRTDDCDLADVVLNIAVVASDPDASGADIAQEVYTQLAYLEIDVDDGLEG